VRHSFCGSSLVLLAAPAPRLQAASRLLSPSVRLARCSSKMSWSGTASGRYADSGNARSHAHLIGGHWVDKSDLAP